MEPGTIMLIGVIAAAVLGGVWGLFLWLRKADKVRKTFGVKNGMTFKEIVAALGRPLTEKADDDKMIYTWYKNIGDKQYNIRGVFRNGIALSIG